MEPDAIKAFYTNPLVNDDFPDPSVIKVNGRGYYAYATHDAFSPTINNILVRHSDDLIHWSDATGALLQPPTWAKTCERFWCPHVVKVDKEFRLYYAAEPDTKDGMCLALATSDNAENFTDCGQPVSRTQGSSYQMIDPCFFQDPVSRRHLFYYGSAHEPIRVADLSPDGRNFTTEPVPVLYPQEEIYQQLREGAFVTYHAQSKRYFLWVSGHNTWVERGYAVSVFWSYNPTSDFTKIPGKHVVLEGNEVWDSPGQNCIITDEAGSDWIIYHAVDTRNRYIPGQTNFMRKMCMDRILYSEDGWPSVINNSPSFTSTPVPVIKNKS